MKAGLEDVVAAETILSHVDGENGRLITRPFRVKQVALVDAQRWGKRWLHNVLERRQVVTASHLHVSYRDVALPGRFEETLAAVQKINSRARLTDAAALVAEIETALSHWEIPVLSPIFPAKEAVKTSPSVWEIKKVVPEKFSHDMAHGFSSAQLRIPPTVEETTLKDWLKSVPAEVLRVKGVTQIAGAPDELCCFQRVADKVEIKLFPLPEDFSWTPIAVLIGAWLPTENFQADADRRLSANLINH